MTAFAAPLDVARAEVLAFDDVYEQHIGFVWRVLRSLGVPPAQLEDAAQDVFVVVHRRLPEFEGRAAITTWLFAITRKIAANHRKRAVPPPALPEPSASASADPFRDAARAEAAAQVAAILDRMDEDKRLVFTLVELEHVSVADVARMLGINANTAASRLRLARGEFAAAVKRAKAQSGGSS